MGARFLLRRYEITLERGGRVAALWCYFELGCFGMMCVMARIKNSSKKLHMVGAGGGSGS